MSLIEYSKSANSIEQWTSSSTPMDVNKTKCAEILVSFTTFTFEFICVLCNEECRYLSFSDFCDHIRLEHAVCPEDENSEISGDGGYTTEFMAEDPLADKMSVVDEEEINGEDVRDKLSVSPTEVRERPKLIFYTAEEVANTISQRDTVTFSQSVPTNEDHDHNKSRERDTPDRQHIIELLEMYRKCIGLWHTQTAGTISNSLKTATLKQLVRKYKIRSSVLEMERLLKRMTMCFNAAWTTNAERDYRPWYFDNMGFLKFADVALIPEREFVDFQCPFCAHDEVDGSGSVGLWKHIIGYHTNSDYLVDSGTNIIPLQWPTEHVLQFIKIYREEESLWNIECRQYHNRSLKQKAYQTVVDKFNKVRPDVLKNRDSVKDTIKHLRDYFRRVDKKYQVSSVLDNNENAESENTENYKIYEELLFLKNVYLPKHIYSKETYTCDLCGKTFRRKALIHEHFKKQHKDSAFKCDKCPMAFGSEEKLHSHRSSHAGGDGNTYNCPICHLDHPNATDLETHLFDHLPDKTHEQVCAICGAKFEERHNLLNHIRRHSNIKNYVCDVCQKGFVTSTELRSHAVVHTSEKPFTCEVCGLGFKYQNRLNTHRLVHEEPRFECKDCSMKFTTKRHLSEHEHLHNFLGLTLEKVVCELCNALFANPDSLRRHKRIVHNIRKRFIRDYSEDKYSQSVHKKPNTV